jgi:ABC-type Na+ transport system ATPase subunit NatA
MRDPDAALDEQIALYRRMTGEERLAIALRLHDLGCDVAREGIRAQQTDADEEGVERLLRRRIEIGREIDRQMG